MRKPGTRRTGVAHTCGIAGTGDSACRGEGKSNQAARKRRRKGMREESKGGVDITRVESTFKTQSGNLWAGKGREGREWKSP